MKVSVIILTLNAGAGFEELLAKIFRQKRDFELEVVVIDSGSTDGTQELARRYGAFVHRIDKSEFNHGATRNLGVLLSRGEYVVFLVQDAMPLDEQWLAAMVENLERDERVAGVFGRQIARKDAGLVTRALVNNLATASLDRREQFAGSAQQFNDMPPKQRRRLAAFENVSSCLRRSVWEEIPFERTSFGEDMRWGKKVIEAGYKTVYEPRSVVFHSHERGSMYDLRRYYVNQMLLLDLFGLKLVPNLKSLLLSIPRTSFYLYRLLRKDKGAGDTLRLALLAAKFALVTQIGTYIGARSGLLASLSPRAFGTLDRFLSKGI